MLEKFHKLCSDVLVLGIKNKNLNIQDSLGLVTGTLGLARYISKNHIDVVNSHDFFSAFITRSAVLISNVFFFHKPKKNIVTLHNIFFWLKKKHHLINRLLSVFTTKIVCVSKSVFEYSFAHDKIKEEKYIIIYNGIDENRFTPNTKMNNKYRELFKFKDSDFIIGNIGTLSVRKGHRYLIEAFTSIHNKFPDAKLVIFGSTRGHEEEIHKNITELINAGGIKDYVHFFDTRDDIKDIYNMFDIFVMPSVSEGLSLSAIEAMLMERICIFSNIGPFKELVVDNQTGMLFESKNSVDLQNKLEKVAANYSNYRNMGPAARSSIVNKFSYNKMIESYTNLYTI